MSDAEEYAEVLDALDDAEDALAEAQEVARDHHLPVLANSIGTFLEIHFRQQRNLFAATVGADIKDPARFVDRMDLQDIDADAVDIADYQQGREDTDE